MTKRVLLPLFFFGLLAVCVILVQVGQAIAQNRTQQIQPQRTEVIEQIALRATAALQFGENAALERYLDRFYDTYGEAVIVVDGAGTRIASVGDIALEGDAARVTTAGLRGVPQRTLKNIYPWSPDTVFVSQPIPGYGSVAAGVITLQVRQTAAKNDIISDWMVVGFIGVALLSALLAASVYWTRWVIRPVKALDDAANAIAEHREFAPTGRSGPPELRRLALSFERMARNVDATLEQQRGLVADASHQLRNPLAAIRLRIDALDPNDAGADLAAVQDDLDRLDHTVERMLVLANAEHRANERADGRREDGSGQISCCVVSAESLLAPYALTLEQAGIRVITQGPETSVKFARKDLNEIIEILVDNAVKYAGAGSTVRLTLTEGAPPPRGVTPGPRTVTLAFSDSGPGLDLTEVPHVGTRFWRSRTHAALSGTGLGHAIIAQLARANCATVAVDAAPEGGLRTQIEVERF